MKWSIPWKNGIHFRQAYIITDAQHQVIRAIAATINNISPRIKKMGGA
jgi:hypothetical protein